MTEFVQAVRSLKELESVIEQGKKTFVEVGKALKQIRDERLYKKNYSSFEEYCQTRWGWTRRNADGYIQALEYIESENNRSQVFTKNQALTSRSMMDVHFPQFSTGFTVASARDQE